MSKTTLCILKRCQQAFLSLALWSGSCGFAHAVMPIDLDWHQVSPTQRLAVDKAVNDYKLLNVYPDKTFRGQRAFSRYEMAEGLFTLQNILHKKYGIAVAVEPRMAAALQIYVKPTGDIPPRHWAMSPVLQVLSTGLMRGDSALHFYGINPVSQGEMAVALYGVFDWLQLKPRTQNTRRTRLNASHWAHTAATSLLQADLLPGDFDASQPATRYQWSTALVRSLEHIEELAKTQSLVPKVVVPLPPEIYMPRPDGRRRPVHYKPQRVP